MFLPYSRQSIEEDDVAAVAAVLRGDWLTTGPAVDAFEQAVKQRHRIAHAAACSSGTAALHLAMMALELGSDDVVVVPTVTFLATANAVRYVGAEVAFADVDPATGLMTAETLADAINHAPRGRLRAAVPVHLGGQCHDPAAIQSTARDHGMAVVEDAAHAIGTTYLCDGRELPIGACVHSDLCIFSFHPVKTVTMGEGGAITANDPAIDEKVRRFRSHGMTRDRRRFAHSAMARDGEGRPNPWYYEMPELGYNYRATDLQCALGMSQLQKLDRFVARRTALVERYDARIAEFSPFIRPLGRSAGVRPAWHLYVVRIDFAALGRSRAQCMDFLRRRGIGSQVHYIPVHQQPYYRARYGPLELSGAEAYYAQALSLPLFVGMADTDADRVCEAMYDFVRDAGCA